MSDSRAGTFWRSFSPWSLRNRRTSVTSFCMSATRCDATGSNVKPEGAGQSAMTRDSPPVNAFHSVSVTNGITGCNSLSKVSSTAASTAVVCVIPSVSCTFASSTYQSQNSSQAKWYNASHARLNS